MDQKRKLSSQRATVSTTPSCKYYYSPLIKTGQKELLQSSRSQVSVSEMQDSKSKGNLLFEKIRAQNISQHKFEYEQFLRLDNDILELYNDYEKNYQSLKTSDQRIKTEVQNIDVEYKRQNSQLIKTFDGLHLSDLDNRSLNHISINRYQFYYFRLKIQEKPAPIHVYLNLPESLSFLLFKLFLSTTIEFPTIFNADQTVQSNYAKLYSKNPRANTFKEEFLYMTFYSQVDFVLKISILFGQFQKKFPSQLVNSQSPQFLKLAPDSELFQTHSERKKKFTKINTQSKLTALLSHIGQQFPTEIINQRQSKIEQVQQNKKHKYEERQLSIRSRLLVKEQLSQFRELEKSYRLKRMQAQYLAKSWRRVMECAILAEQLYNVIQQNKRRSKVVAKGKLIVWAMKTKTLIQAKEYGNTQRERTLSKSSIVLTMFACHIKKEIQKQSQGIFTSFLLQMKLAITILNQHDKTMKKIIQIQRNFKALKQKKVTYRDKLMRLIKDNLNPVLVELQRQNGKKQFYDNDEKPVIHYDFPCITQIIDEYNTQKKLVWYEYINSKFFEKDLHKKMHELAVNLKEPQLYDLPKKKELIKLIEKYGKLKKLL